jgi:hypothetical protein
MRRWLHPRELYLNTIAIIANESKLENNMMVHKINLILITSKHQQINPGISSLGNAPDLISFNKALMTVSPT